MPTDRVVVAAQQALPRTEAAVSSGRHTSGDSGSSLVEVMVAIALIGTVMAAAAPFLVKSLAVSNQQRGAQVAIQIANDALERVRALAPLSLLTGRGRTAVEAQWNQARLTAPDTLVAHLDDMQAAWDTNVANASGRDAPLPTEPHGIAVNGSDFAQHWYVGLCWQAKAVSGHPLGDCGPTSGPVPFFRVLVAVTWQQQECPANGCVYVASTLVNKGTDPVFDTKRPAPTVTDPAAQFGYVDSAASLQILSSGGRLPLTWTATGLPPGLSMASTGLITGTPSTVGTYSVKVTVTDRDSRTDDATFAWTIVEDLVLTSPGDQTSWIGTAVSLSVPRTGGRLPLVWSATGLPAGLTINASTGVISGTPTTFQTLTTTVTVSDAGTPARTASVTFGWRVNPVQIDAIAPMNVTQDANATGLTPTARYGQPPYSWQATGLPTGLAINPSTGAVTGKYADGTRYLTTFTVTDSTGAVATMTVVVNVAAKTPADVQVTAPSPDSPNQSTAVDATPSLTTAGADGGGGNPRYVWTAAGLPPGLTVETDGAITGRPTTKGVYVVTLTVTAHNGKAANLMFTWTVT
ncbi:hypothetical protein DMB66_40935 [Actinoplanes sp. ATCC 53533]|uniref:putative Ig domain-containing protein n=1 Tax=Actinoplanes sp. ATCC 53533 TaxID=1288362 RepID=UPI000F7751CE|nr:putative Ig domain-containing protein [Actinoplanes sp. ATCC 53533]RSM51801.1 hypothetical protein DMB66_40935 [Actinoplanes sp. ATCC 53533]